MPKTERRFDGIIIGNLPRPTQHEEVQLSEFVKTARRFDLNQKGDWRIAAKSAAHTEAYVKNLYVGLGT